nr:hypothetical protein [Nitrosomonas europaea]
MAVASPKDVGIGAGFAIKHIVARATGNQIIVVTTVDAVVTPLAEQAVGAGVAIETVVAFVCQHDVGFVGEPDVIVARSESAHLEFVKQHRDACRLRQSVDRLVEIRQPVPVGAGEETVGVAVEIEQVGQIVLRVGSFLVRLHLVELRGVQPQAAVIDDEFDLVEIGLETRLHH